jgi:DNA-binding transcriptional ArsR family regulator
MTAALIEAVNHPLRRKLLRTLHSSDDARSPIQLSKIIGGEVSTVAYHMKALASRGAAEKTGYRHVRGARENFFVSKVSGHRQVIAILADTEGEDDEARR